MGAGGLAESSHQNSRPQLSKSVPFFSGFLFQSRDPQELRVQGTRQGQEVGLGFVSRAVWILSAICSRHSMFSRQPGERHKGLRVINASSHRNEMPLRNAFQTSILRARGHVFLLPTDRCLGPIIGDLHGPVGHTPVGTRPPSRRAGLP